MGLGMNLESRKADPLDVLRAVNDIDSALFGLSIDIFKVRLLIMADLSYELTSLGFDADHANICFDFRQVENLVFSASKANLGPAYLEDGDLALMDLFSFDSIEIKKAGETGITDRLNVYGERREVHEVRISFRLGGIIQFEFADLEYTTFDPLDLDKRCSR